MKSVVLKNESAAKKWLASNLGAYWDDRDAKGAWSVMFPDGSDTYTGHGFTLVEAINNASLAVVKE